MSGLYFVPVVGFVSYLCWRDGGRVVFWIAVIAVVLNAALIFFECMNLKRSVRNEGVTPTADRGATEKESQTHWQRNAAPLQPCFSKNGAKP